MSAPIDLANAEDDSERRGELMLAVDELCDSSSGSF